MMARQTNMIEIAITMSISPVQNVEILTTVTSNQMNIAVLAVAEGLVILCT